MTGKILSSGLFAGLAGGLFAALLQFTFIVPLIAEGELYEDGTRVHFTEIGAQSDAGAPSLVSIMTEDPTRHLGTLAFDFVSFTAFAMFLVAGFAIAEKRGHRIDAGRGLLWGIAGFVAVHLAPAFSLPPELPGMIAAPLQDRQLWWVGTVLATAAALGLFAYGRSALLAGLGIVLIAAPHIVGAPHYDQYFGQTPPELSSLFVARSLGVGAMAWSVLGLMAGALWARR